MARRRPVASPPPDPYEQAFEATHRRRVERETPAVLPPDPLSPGGKAPPRWGWKWLLGALAVALAIGLARGGGTSAPSLRADCAHPAFVLSTYDVKARSDTLVHWSATGPSTSRFFLAIGASRIDVTPRRVTAVPEPGQHSQVASKLENFGKSCLRHGEFGVLVPAGSYAVGLYQLDPTQATELAHASFTVRKN